MSNAGRQPALQQEAQTGSDRAPEQAPPPDAVAPQQAQAAPEARGERPTDVLPLQRPPPPTQRPQASSESSDSAPSTLRSTISRLNLAERFEPEARDLNPQLVHPHFNAQNLYNQVFEYYEWRFTDIAYGSDSTIAYVAQIQTSANRVAIIVLNAIVNKLIIGNQADGLPVVNLANPRGPPKGFLFPALSCGVIAAVGKTSPKWSGDQYFMPDLNNTIPAFNDYLGVAVNNIHQFPANPAQDTIVHRFCNAGKIHLRSVDWKIPGGTPHWLVVRQDQNQRTTISVAPDVHPDNFDPPNTLLASVCACTNFDAAATRYIIMKSIATNTVWTMNSEVYEK